MFHRALERLDVAGWQVIQEDEGLRILLAQPASGIDLVEVGLAVTTALEGVDVRGINIKTQAVDAIPRTALGKAPLIRVERQPAQLAGLVRSDS